jgi:NAD(P)-dependent dehydrogenase (short-subunit alcohol dehydrogenase family)
VKAWENDPELKERFHFAAADVSKREDAERFVKEAAKRWGHIDVLVNNAGAVLFLTDAANSYLTGQVIVVDGGLTC